MSRTVSVLLSLYHCRHNCLCSTIERTTLWFYYISNCLCSTVSVPLPLQLSLFYSRADSFMVLHYLELSQFYCLCTTVATTVSVAQDSGQLYGSTISRTVSVPLSLRLSLFYHRTNCLCTHPCQCLRLAALKEGPPLSISRGASRVARRATCPEVITLSSPCWSPLLQPQALGACSSTTHSQQLASMHSGLSGWPWYR